jgi:predicted HTH transcriptional regulator
MIELSDTDLLLRLQNFEDNFVERKTISDYKDWLKTAVAFANSTPIGYPAVLFVGVRDDGTVQVGNNANLEKLQRSVSEKINDAYPPIYHFHRVLQDENGNQFLAVIIPGSEQRPHFAGQAYVRVGSDSKAASEPQFQTLIAQRQSKAYEILKWKDRQITLQSHTDPTRLHLKFNPVYVILEDCNQFYLTYKLNQARRSLPIAYVEISFDDVQKCLKLIVPPYAVG